MTDAADEDPGYGDKRWRKWGLIDHDGGVMEKYSELIWLWRFYYMPKCYALVRVVFQQINADLWLCDDALTYCVCCTTGLLRQYNQCYILKASWAICESAAMSMSHLFNFISQHNSDLETVGKLALIKLFQLTETQSFCNVRSISRLCFPSPDEATWYILHCSNDEW